MKSRINIIFVLLLITVLFAGQASAQVNSDISNAIYQNPSYIQESTSKTNCDLNGAWSTEYSYYWLSDPTNSQTNLPSYVKNITYTGVVQENNSISISTPENASLTNGRNKYYLSSSLDGESLEITLDLENTNNFITWLPLTLYFDPFVIKNPEEQIKLKLSYANSPLGNIIYIQNTKFNVGCYLNLLVKSPDPKSTGKLTIELSPQYASKAAISGIFWSEPRQESNLKVTYTGLNKISAPSWAQNLRTDSSAKAGPPQVENTVIWSPENLNEDDFIKIGVGKATYTTSTGYEFPKSLKDKDFYNFKVLQGMKGPKGVNGLEFYLTPDKNICLNGCEFGLYFTESYKQNIFIYPAEKGKKNNLAAKAETPGDGSPAFQKFHIDPNSNVQLRIRLTTNDLVNTPVLRGLYIAPSRSENKNVDSDNIVLNPDSNITVPNQLIIPITSAGIIQIPQVNIFTADTSKNTIKTNDSNEGIITKVGATTQNTTNLPPLLALQPKINLPAVYITQSSDTVSDSNDDSQPKTDSPAVSVTQQPTPASSSNNNAPTNPIIKHAPIINIAFPIIPRPQPKPNDDGNKAQEEAQEEAQKAQEQAIEDTHKTAEEAQKTHDEAQDEDQKDKEQAIEDTQKAAEEAQKTHDEAQEEAQKAQEQAIEDTHKTAEEAQKAQEIVIEAAVKVADKIAEDIIEAMD